MKKELKKLRLMAPMSAEAAVVRNYLDWVLGLPWGVYTQDKLDVNEAERILDEEHYGLKRVKERILEYLAVQALVRKQKGPILCLVGPPGVGKTSLAKSIARATGRNFVRLALGGVRDEAEIRGHRRTYIGALPGKIIQSLKKAGSSNPVFLLDEVDKMSTDFRGDPSAALLEVLDPEQNAAFNDHYLDLDYDLSRRHVRHHGELPAGHPGAAAGPHGDHPAARLHRVREGVDRRALPAAQAAQGQRHRRPAGGAPRGDHPLDHPQLHQGSGRPQPGAGDRHRLPQDRQGVHRQPGAARPGRSTPKRLAKYLGPMRYRTRNHEVEDEIGLVNGLAVTMYGGDLLDTEVSVVAGKGKLVLTGKLGDVMQESAQAAISYVRARGPSLGLDRDFYTRADIHVHLPEGAIPKDGPSAGITMCTGLVSALLRIPVRRDVAMTGEITLRGRVLAIGGLKEKILAAHRAGIRTVILPKENVKDLQDIPKRILKALRLVPVAHMDEVLRVALALDHEAEHRLPEGAVGGRRLARAHRAPRRRRQRRPPRVHPRGQRRPPARRTGRRKSRRNRPPWRPRSSPSSPKAAAAAGASGGRSRA